MPILARKVDSGSPVSAAACGSTRIVGKEVSFASGSSDNPGVVEYWWSLGDGVEAMGEKVAHVYAQPGAYT